jgi:hypothetical protein
MTASNSVAPRKVITKDPADLHRTGEHRKKKSFTFSIEAP